MLAMRSLRFSPLLLSSPVFLVRGRGEDLVEDEFDRHGGNCAEFQKKLSKYKTTHAGCKDAFRDRTTAASMRRTCAETWRRVSTTEIFRTCESRNCEFTVPPMAHHLFATVIPAGDTNAAARVPGRPAPGESFGTPDEELAPIFAKAAAAFSDGQTTPDAPVGATSIFSSAPNRTPAARHHCRRRGTILKTRFSPKSAKPSSVSGSSASALRPRSPNRLR